jgi:hypothetical protein
MRPDELPQQKVYAVTDLPQTPSNFEAAFLMQFGSEDDRHDYDWSIPEADLPQRFPGAATFVGQVEWAWDPSHDRIDSYYICSNRKRSHWFLWLRCPDDNTGEFRMNSILYAYCPRGTTNRKSAAIHLLLHAWRYEVAESERDRFDWINDTGLLGVSEVHAIARAVWENRVTGNEQTKITERGRGKNE